MTPNATDICTAGASLTIPESPSVVLIAPDPNVYSSIKIPYIPTATIVIKNTTFSILTRVATQPMSVKIVPSITNLSIVARVTTDPLVVKFVPAIETLAVKLVLQGGESSGSASSQSGFIFVTGVTSSGNVGSIVHVPNTVPLNVLVQSCIVDNSNVVVHFLAEGGVYYSPVVTVDGITCTNLQQHPDDRRLFYGSVTINLAETKNILVQSDTGRSASVLVTKVTGGPIILGVKFLGNYPSGQTEVKSGDTTTIRILFDTSGPKPGTLYVENYGACSAKTVVLNSTLLDWPTQDSMDVQVTIRTTSNTLQELPVRCYAKTIIGTTGESVLSSTASVLSGNGTIKCNDVVPSFIDRGTTFPIGQLAFKGVETGIQATEVLNYSYVTYTSPTNDFDIVDTTTYAQNKTIQCKAPAYYNGSTVNFRIQANRVENNTSAIFQKIIEVANIAPVVTITQPYSRLRSSLTGTNYAITATSNQNMHSSVMLSLNVPIAGTWQGAGFTGGPKVFTRYIRITDGAISGTGLWQFVTVPKNNAGILATIQGSQTVGGFVSRVLPLPAFNTVTTTSAKVTDTSKLNLIWNMKDNMVFSPIGTAPPVVFGWTINNTNISPTDFIILDLSAAAASSQESYITIEEVV